VQAERKSVYFVSDAHLGSGPEPERRERALATWLTQLRARASHLYILGDLFDFWFEYRHAIPRGHFRVLRALADLADAGIAIAYLGGNHDFWCGSYLEQEIGVRVHYEAIRVEHEGRRIFLAHGDGLGPGDRGYRLLKAILRHPLAIGLYRSLHPDLGIPLAHRVSGASRDHSRDRRHYLQRLARHVATPEYGRGSDAIVIGHIHDPLHLQDSAGRDFLIAGDWIEAFTYVELRAGTFRLQRWQERERAAEALAARPWPAGLEPLHGGG